MEHLEARRLLGLGKEHKKEEVEAAYRREYERMQRLLREVDDEDVSYWQGELERLRVGREVLLEGLRGGGRKETGAGGGGIAELYVSAEEAAQAAMDTGKRGSVVAKATEEKSGEGVSRRDVVTGDLYVSAEEAALAGVFVAAQASEKKGVVVEKTSEVKEKRVSAEIREEVKTSEEQVERKKSVTWWWLGGMVLLVLCGVVGVWGVGVREGRKGGVEHVYRVGDVEYKMRWIPAGEFLMGSPAGEGDNDEKPQHKVAISRGYWMMENEVTQGQWKAVMGSNPSYFSSYGDGCPVEKVSWHEAAAFANRLSKAQGLEACFVCEGEGADVKCEGVGDKGGEYIVCKGWRLPTEAEWEYAARAGTSTAHYGEVGKIAWYDGNSGSKTHPVGLKEGNNWGLHDMSGNVWEWVYDVWDSSAYSGRSNSTSTRDPVRIGNPSERVERGGSWILNAWGTRSASRSRYTPTNRFSNLGFRLVRFD